ncbi:hypothetical protein BKA62DRAFT_687850 [Auriculariales sp. MPI-PUGE-AT-0066]|nr:hypothetical protein BKA62DRAFT_687850 [Auriculariales sp. MPI-PUGE-AT-0066]
MQAPSPVTTSAQGAGAMASTSRSPMPSGQPEYQSNSAAPASALEGIVIKQEPLATDERMDGGGGYSDLPEELPDPQSPRESVSPPPPDGPLGDCETEIVALHQALYELGCALFETKAGARPNLPPKVNQVITHLAEVERIAQHIQVAVPFQVLEDIDQGRNPHNLTRERLERTATENQFMHGKVTAVEVSRDPVINHGR